MWPLFTFITPYLVLKSLKLFATNKTATVDRVLASSSFDKLSGKQIFLFFLYTSVLLCTVAFLCLFSSLTCLASSLVRISGTSVKIAVSFSF